MGSWVETTSWHYLSSCESYHLAVDDRLRRFQFAEMTVLADQAAVNEAVAGIDLVDSFARVVSDRFRLQVLVMRT